LSIFFGTVGPLFDQAHDAPQVINRCELDNDLALGPTELNLHSSLKVVGQPIGEVLGFRRHHPGLTSLTGRSAAVIA
jgi:hypothetical protein